MRNILIAIAAVLAASSLVAQSHTVEIVNYMGGSLAGVPPWGMYRSVDYDNDGVYLTQIPDETIDFANDGNNLVNHIEDIKFRDEAGVPVIYATAATSAPLFADVVLRMVDLDGNGRCDDPGELVTFADFGILVGSGTSPDGLDFDPNTGELYVTDDIWGGGSLDGSGIHQLVDLNGDGDAMDAGEWLQWVDAANGSQTVLGNAGQQVAIDIGDFEAVMVDSNGLVIAFAQQDLAIYAMQDLNGDGDAMDLGEMTNFLNLVGDKPGLVQNADVVNGLLANPSCLSTSGSGLYATLEWMDISHGAGPGGADVYWIASTASNSSCSGAGGFVFQGIDLNGDGDLNDSGEVTAFHDTAISALPTPPSGIFGMSAHDDGVSIWTDSPSKDVYYIFDTNGDRKTGAGEWTHLATFPSNPFAEGICAVPVGAFAVPPPPPPYFLTFGDGGVGSNGLTPEIGNVGTPVVGGSFDVTVANALPNVPVQLIVGLSNTVWNRPAPLPLPFDMGPVGAPGNTLYVAVDYTFQTFANFNGDAAITLTPPNVPSWIGTQVYFQWGCSDSINTRGLVMSNAGQSIIE